MYCTSFSIKKLRFWKRILETDYEGFCVDCGCYIRIGSCLFGISLSVRLYGLCMACLNKSISLFANLVQYLQVGWSNFKGEIDVDVMTTLRRQIETYETAWNTESAQALRARRRMKKSCDCVFVPDEELVQLE